MKSIIRTLLVCAAFPLLFAACSSDDEPSWDKTWDEKIIEQGEEDYIYPDPHFIVSGVIIGGEVKRLTSELVNALREEVAQPAKYPVEVSVTAPGNLKEAIGRRALEMDALSVSGPINSDDIRYVKLCVCSGKLRRVDFAKALLEENTLPENAFFASEYGSIVYVPLCKLVLPENIEKLDKSCLFNTLITEIELPERIILEATCLANTPMLGGEITISDGMVFVDPGISCYGQFVPAGDGSMIVNFKRKTVDFFNFSGFCCKEFNIAEGVEEIEPGALFGMSIESLTLPKSLKKIGEYSMCNISNLKSLYINFTDASIVGISESDYADMLEKMIIEIMEEGGDISAIEEFDSKFRNSFPFIETTADAVYVPKGTKSSFAEKMPMLHFQNIIEMDE